MKNKILIPLSLILLFFASQKTFAHCEVPCGIYDDELRIALLYEHFTTIEKAMIQIEELSKEENVNYNQLVRWINTKEEHAIKIQDIANQYFLTQRIKPTDESDEVEYKKYIKELRLMHSIIVLAMKTKQTTDQKYIEKLRANLADFETSYFEGKHRHNPDGSHK
jgi:nickel superoxide dismutase